MKISFLVALVAALLLTATTAQAAEDVVIQGTTDIRDAGLLDDVIVPGFEDAYPQYNLQYVAVGTGQALTNARAGQGDAVVTHAAPLEAQFVADGYSAEQYGRAIFYSDYVILGPSSDPAGVLSAAPHEAAKALELIAAAGDGGQAHFVSRGDNSGTNVAEQQIWNLTSGVTLCDVATGRKQPSTATGACDSPPSVPSWYHRANLGQAATVQLADQCPYSPANSCYEMTDRGTFNRLVSTGAITNLELVSDRNDAGARGGEDLLVNSFHAYAVNPDKFSPGTIDQTGATAFLDYLTSPALQDRLASYPDTSNPAFFKSAAPEITVDQQPGAVEAGQQVSLSGSVRNRVPGTPPLDGVEVSVLRTGEGTAGEGPAATATTDSDGSWELSFRPNRGGVYSVNTPLLTETILPGPPPFGDIQQPAGRLLDPLTLNAKLLLDDVVAKRGAVVVSGRARPSSNRDAPKLILKGKRLGKPGAKARRLGTADLAKSGAGFTERFPLRPGRYSLRVTYVDRGAAVQPDTSDAVKVRVAKG